MLSVNERFWARVDKTAPSGCWEWTGTLTHNGYGLLSVNRKMIRAHRLSYEMLRGRVPDGLFVLHSCDNRRCVNPEHLRCGTAMENSGDRKARETTGWKLCPSAVREIKQRLAAREMTQAAIAETYGVTQALVNNIWRGRAWAQVPWPEGFDRS